MAVQQEIKSQLAKLLATEDLVVEHKQVETAQFNVQTRVLTLPIWDKASNDVYDMLVGHEVGHALFTPDEDWTEKVKIPQQFVNVCEDVRIEKLMKRKYMGIAKTFYRGYNELNDKDFFQIEDEDITKFNLADRINLFYKVGSFVDLVFSDTEKKIVDLVGSAETFDQMLDAAVTLYDYCKQQQEQQQKVANIDAHNQEKQDIKMDFPQPTEEDGEKEETEGKSPQSPQMDASGDEGGDLPEQSEPEYEPDVQTADSLQDNLQSLVNKDGVDSVYVEVPKLNLDNIIIDNAEIHAHADLHFIEQQEKANEILYREGISKNLYEEADGEYVKFKRDAQKEVSYLVKEFECRKAADNYARSTTSRTGVLNTAKLHTYRFNEDLFKKINVVPDGKNHGLVFILDWSGSMAGVMMDTVKQLYNLVWFCRKVNIPFEVYAFTQEWHRSALDSYERSSFKNELYDKKEYVFQIDDTFSLLNLLTSKVNSKTLEHQMINIFRTAASFNQNINTYYSYPSRLQLSGTPLNETLVALHQILPQFQKENKVQKVQCIVLTDGEANTLGYHREVTRTWRDGEDDTFLGCRRLNPQTSFLRDRKCGKTYAFGYDYHEFTDTLLTNLKDRFPTVNFIGMRLLANRDALRFAKCYHSEYSKEYATIQTNWRKQKSFIINNSGYDAYFALSASNLADDVEFEVKDDATKAQIKRAFVKSLKTKKLNKKVLGEFIQLVA